MPNEAIVVTPEIIYVTSGDYLIKLDDLEYPVSFDQFRDRKAGIYIPPRCNLEVIRNFGYDVVFTVPPPVADITVLGDPEKRDDGYWYQTWKSRSFTAEELWDQLVYRKMDFYQDSYGRRDSAYIKGFLHTFTEGEFRVGLTTDHRVTLADIRVRAKEALDSNPDAKFSLQLATQYKTVQLTPQEAIDLADKAFSIHADVENKVATYNQFVLDVKFAADLPAMLDELIP